MQDTERAATDVSQQAQELRVALDAANAQHTDTLLVDIFKSQLAT